MILGGDIGGTKTNLALFEEKGEELSITAEEKYPSSEHGSLDEIVEDFIKKHSAKLESAAFGIAGPVNREHVKATNLPWEVDAKKLSTITNCPVHLINDLEANAWGIHLLKEDEFELLYKGTEENMGNQALISAGTGLGEAGLYYDGKKHLPFACEGGHADFAPRNDTEIALLKFLSKKYGHVSYERALSGHALKDLYAFFKEDQQLQGCPEVEKALSHEDPGKIISEHGLKGSDPICTKVLDLMVSLYGAAAGNLALKFLASGGVYLGGGIAPKILPKLKSPLFIDSYLEKGRFKSLLEKFSVRVILNDKTALLGAGACARHKKNT